MFFAHGLFLASEPNYTLFIEALPKDFSGERNFWLDSTVETIDDLLILDHFLYSSSNQPLIILFKKVTFLKYLRHGRHGFLGTSRYGFCLFFNAVLLNYAIFLFIYLNSLIYFSFYRYSSNKSCIFMLSYERYLYAKRWVTFSTRNFECTYLK